MTDTTVPTQTNVEVPQIDTAKIVEEASRLTAEQLESSIQEKIDQATSEAQRRAEEAIVERIAGKKEPEKWVPKSYEEIVERAKSEALAEAERKEAEKSKKLEEYKKQQEVVAKQKQEDLKKYWDSQLTAMEQDGRLPKIDESITKKLQANEKLSDEELLDPAVKARQDLYKLAHEHKEPNLELVYYKYLQGKRQHAGMADAPIGGVRRSVSDQNDVPFTWEEIHSTPIEQIAKEALSPK